MSGPDPSLPLAVVALVSQAVQGLVSLVKGSDAKKLAAGLKQKVNEESEEIRGLIDDLAKRIDEGLAKVNARIDRVRSSTGSHPSIDPGLAQQVADVARRVEELSRRIAEDATLVTEMRREIVATGRELSGVAAQLQMVIDMEKRGRG